MFEYTFDLGSNHDVLSWIAQQVAHHPDAAGFRKLDKDRKVGAVLS